jgi:hypothetical protein
MSALRCPTKPRPVHHAGRLLLELRANRVSDLFVSHDLDVARRRRNHLAACPLNPPTALAGASP